jgi:hypothetical protein
VVVLGEGQVDDGVAVGLKRQVDLGEVFVRVQKPDITFLVTDRNEAALWSELVEGNAAKEPNG